MAEQTSYDGTARDYYDATGREYDYITRAQDYRKWVPMYAGLIKEHSQVDGRLLDLGCGTGKSAIGFRELGFDVTGVDISEEMLRVAREKTESTEVSFVAADMRALPALGSFAVVTAMGEPFSNLADISELQSTFASVANVLEPGGLVVFDMPTRGFHDRYVARNIVDAEERRMVVWHNRYLPDDRNAVETTVEDFIKVDDENWRRTSRRLVHRYFSPGEVSGQLELAGFETVVTPGLYQGVLRHCSDQDLHRKSIVVARKAAPETAITIDGENVHGQEEVIGHDAA